MKKNILVRGIACLTIIVIIGLLSCIPITPPSPVPLPPPAPTATLTPTATDTPTPTATIAPTATPIPPFTFAVCGDNRGGDEIYSEILRLVQDDSVAFLVNTGDLVHRGDAAQFQHFAELMDGFSLPFFPVAGNHDDADGLLDEYLRYSGAPDVHYSFDYGLGHFVIIDSHYGVLYNQELEWLEADLAATDQPLKMVFVHHPPFDPDGTYHVLGGGNQRFMAMMEEYDVSYVFAGHIHAYVEGERNGVRYIITGGAGAPLSTKEHPLAFYHYIRVNIDGSEVSTEVVKVERRFAP